MSKTKLAILAALTTSIALADDFKTIDGKEYKNATVSRVEPDGIVLITKSGISKVYFTELPKDVQERFHYDAAKAAEFTSQTTEKIDQLLQQRAEKAQQRSGKAKRRPAPISHAQLHEPHPRRLARNRPEENEVSADDDHPTTGSQNTGEPAPP